MLDSVFEASLFNIVPKGLLMIMTKK